MTKHTDNEFPANWHAGMGEASRPLHEGGYYEHRYYRVLPGSNQHVERFLELTVDTSGVPPAAHHIVLNYCTEDGEEVNRQKRLATRSVDVLDRTSQAQQESAEEKIHDIAEELMRRHADWTPP